MPDRGRTPDARSRAHAGTQAAEFSGPQILGEGLLRFDRQEGRGDNPRLYQKSGDGGQAVGSDAIQARVLMKSRLLYQNPYIPYYRLWRFPFKPPGLLGVIGCRVRDRQRVAV